MTVDRYLLIGLIVILLGIFIVSLRAEVLMRKARRSEDRIDKLSYRLNALLIREIDTMNVLAGALGYPACPREAGRGPLRYDIGDETMQSLALAAARRIRELENQSGSEGSRDQGIKQAFSDD